MNHGKPVLISSPVIISTVIAMALAGCVEQPRVASGPGVKIYAFDLSGGARSCKAPDNVAPTPGRETAVAMSVSNEGGWCAFKVDQTDAKAGGGSKPFSAALVTARAAHGKVYVHTVGNDTRVDYTPDARFTGTDAFTVEMLPGGVSIRTTVTVTAS